MTSLLTLLIKPAEVQAASKPSVPQFTVKFIDKSYDVPPTQTTDPYTGIITATPGYRVNEGWIEVTIKNQPFTPETGNNNRLYYLVEAKGFFGGDNDWYSLAYTDTGYVEQSDSGYTVLNYLARFDSGVKLDIRAKAVVGYLQLPIPIWTVVVVSSSEYSKIQTITITYGSSLFPSSHSTSLPEDSPAAPDNNQPQTPDFVFNPFFLLSIGALVGGAIVAAVLIFTRHYLTPSLTKQQSLKT